MDNELFSYLDGEVPVYWYDKITGQTGNPHHVHLELYTSNGYCTEVSCSTCPVHTECQFNGTNLNSLRRLCPHSINDYPELFI